MILTEEVRTPSGATLLRTWSSLGWELLQEGTGHRYTEALDPIGSGRSYTEVEPEEEPEEETETEGSEF